MIYLLDVNALLALGFHEHESHQRAAQWTKKTGANEGRLATCAITELGFLRILMQRGYTGFTITQGQKLLADLKRATGLRFVFLTDDQGAADLPGWVKWAKQVTDGHLVALARAHGAILATLDEGIRGAFVIPR
jgi:predicted nucleic acid-binding protein